MDGSDTYKLILQIHHMTALLEAVDWDEEKQLSLIEFVKKSINVTDDSSFLKEIELDYGSRAKKAVKNIINSEAYYMKLHDSGDYDDN